MSNTMAKTKKQLEAEAFEELKRKALEPFKPQRTMEDVLKHEQEIREESIKAIHKMKEDIGDTERENILARASFEHNWN